jgi:predicted HTH transcriptional regulator
MNATGGSLFVGVTDDNQINGLKNDYQTLGRKKNSDAFENHLTNLMSSHIGSYFLKFIQISFHTIDDIEICWVQVYPSTQPAYLTYGTEQKFYVRVGKSTKPFSISEANQYINEHWEL